MRVGRCHARQGVVQIQIQKRIKEDESDGEMKHSTGVEGALQHYAGTL